MKKSNLPISRSNKLTAASLFTAVLGVILQILSGANYPKVPPVFFILLIPAGMILLSRRRWVPVLALVAGCFLVAGLFGSGAWVRLFTFNTPGDSIGLWIQTIGDVAATAASAVALFQNYRLQPA